MINRLSAFALITGRVLHTPRLPKTLLCLGTIGAMIHMEFYQLTALGIFVFGISYIALTGRVPIK